MSCIIPANACQCRIDHAADGMISVLIDDDGVGIGSRLSETHHYGMSIMQERARSLGEHSRYKPDPRAARASPSVSVRERRISIHSTRALPHDS